MLPTVTGVERASSQHFDPNCRRLLSLGAGFYCLVRAGNEIAKNKRAACQANPEVVPRTPSPRETSLSVLTKTSQTQRDAMPHGNKSTAGRASTRQAR